MCQIAKSSQMTREKWLSTSIKVGMYYMLNLETFAILIVCIN